MFPEETPREEPQRRALRHEHEDLGALPFPLGDWGEPAERLEELYRWAEAGALRTADWYARDRVWKRRGARGLRVAAAVCASAGAALPLIELAAGPGGAHRAAVWGYPALLLAGVCLGFDRLLGLTSGWMRDVATAQAVRRRLDNLRFDWASESVREVLGPTEGTAAEAAERCLGILRRFCEDVADLVRMETSDWMVDFGASAAGAPLRTQSAAWWPVVSPAGPRPAHPSARPNMPRQRPPEGPR
ncbi:SLATT domain-containing protein [Streptomyces sp.]|uniref:SLATT domain-containing protein n=1 Tax=Streptomyces sp. TaxID=1931 RepID=UPI002F411BE7